MTLEVDWASSTTRNRMAVSYTHLDVYKRQCVFLASGDLSHKLLAEGPYGYAAEGPVFDHDLVALLDAGDLEGLFRFDEAFLQEMCIRDRFLGGTSIPWPGCTPMLLTTTWGWEPALPMTSAAACCRPAPQ